MFAVAIALRALHLWFIKDTFFFNHLQTEPARYLDWAGALLDGRAHLHPPLDESPGYPCLVAAVFATAGRRVLAVTAVQAALDAGTCVLVFIIGRRIGGARVGWMAGLLAALYGPLVYFTGELLPATSFVFILACATALQPNREDVKRNRRPAFLASLACGALWAIALLMRAEAVFALPVALLLGYRSGGSRGLMAIAAAPLLLLAASTSVNYANSGHFVPLTSGAGVNLWLGNNPLSDGVNPFVHGPLASVAADVDAQARTSVEADLLFRRHALDFIRAEPGAWLRLCLRKLLFTLSDRELPNTSDIDWQVHQSRVFRLPWFPLHFGLLLPLAIIGLCAGGRLRQCATLLPSVAVAIGTCLMFFTNARFRIVLAIALLPLAALGVDALLRFASLRNEWPQRQLRTALISLIGAALALAVAFGDLDGVREYRIAAIDANTGALELASGRPAAAVPLLLQAIEGDPNDVINWIELLRAEEQGGLINEARETARRGTAQFPDDVQWRQAAARFRRRNSN